MTEITLEQVSKAYRSGETTVTVLDEVDLHVDSGESVLIFGPSGSGKSTLLNLVGGLDRADSGRVVVGGTDLSTLDDAGLTRFRREQVGIIFQFYNLIPSLTALENVELGIEPVVDRPRETAREYLELVGLHEKGDRFPGQLSGGEQQRVGIARALAKHPGVVIADEPTGNLDRKTALQVLDVMARLNEEENLTLVLVSHDPAVEAIADRTLGLEGGTLRETATLPRS